MVGWLSWLRFKLGFPTVLDRRQQLLADIREIDNLLENLNFREYNKIDVWGEVRKIKAKKVKTSDQFSIPKLFFFML